MGNSQYSRQHYITHHCYKYSLPSVAGFIRQSGYYYLFPLPEISGEQGSKRVKCQDPFWKHEVCARAEKQKDVLCVRSVK